MARPKSIAIRDFIMAGLLEHPADIASVTSTHFGISRQAVNRHLKALESDGQIIASGQTRGRSYEFVALQTERFERTVAGSPSEDVSWRRDVLPHLKGVRPAVLDICRYGFTEMVNNVLDHSEAKTLTVELKLTTGTIELDVIDDGIGIFKKIQEALELEEPRHAILELAKGKFTTDPESHTGEGIFFTSRVCDLFAIHSGNLTFGSTRGEDWLIEDQSVFVPGTVVEMEISRYSSRLLEDVFSRYSSGPDEYGFTRTRIPVKLAQYEGESLVSRSQAKRLVARFEKFREVLLDFDGVEKIGPAFADEIFRVFRNEHPETAILWTNANRQVEAMIRRARPNG